MPPRPTTPPPSVRHSSSTLPNMSNKPNALGSLPPTACVVPSAFQAHHAKRSRSCQLSAYQGEVLPARQANSQCFSSGKTYARPSVLLSQAQNSLASCTLSPATGWSSDKATSACRQPASPFVSAVVL